MKIKSGHNMTPERVVKVVLSQTQNLKYDRISIGYPGPVVHNRPLKEPFNLGKGWLRFDLVKALGGKPLRMINDAALQALGSYKGGRMLFLGLGTGLGSAMVVEGIVQDMEIAHLPWRKGKTYEDDLGLAGLKRRGRRRWASHVLEASSELQAALNCDSIVLGGGNAKLVKDLPTGIVLGSNDDAFRGGFLLWKKEHSGSS